MPLMMTPIYERILVRRDPTATKSEGGIEFAEAHAQPALVGTVIAAGIGHRRPDGTVTPLLVKVDDRVVFGVHGGINMPSELAMGRDLVMLREDEIQGIITDEPS